jgi:hypothetical protein
MDKPAAEKVFSSCDIGFIRQGMSSFSMKYPNFLKSPEIEAAQAAW